MYGTNEIIKAGRITSVASIDSISEDYRPSEVFSLFLAPTQGSEVEVGDIMEFDAILPHTNGEYVTVPVVVGDWSPIVFVAIKANALDLEKVNAYTSPMKEIVL